MTRVGVLLSGSGFRDGSEIREAVLTLLALEEAGATVKCFAPNKPQAVTVDHLTGKPEAIARNVLIESARIARGDVHDVRDASPADLDALVIPGGFGAALNLCDFAQKGDAMTVDADVERLLRAMHEAEKPIGAVCIAPVLFAKVFARQKAKVTIGHDAGTAAKITAMGATHQNCLVSDALVDEANRLVTTPAYMEDAGLPDIYKGIRKLAHEVVRMARAPKN